MPALVRVTNLENGRSIVLRVNDRGPFVNGRLIDVSSRAAELLGFKDKGTARVRVQILTEESRQVAELARQGKGGLPPVDRSEEHTSELQSLLRISYAVLCLKKKTNTE